MMEQGFMQFVVLVVLERILAVPGYVTEACRYISDVPVDIVEAPESILVVRGKEKGRPAGRVCVEGQA